ncbi:MFS transporter [Nitrospirillum pindoramense]|uniref:DHA1 family tetracycline resistance protein-like MFS transporter n=1 Tax=Nitrospirillum amazonense TaxID=28077 RepID=A0A560GYL2_9PROT|nr:MFS transporter [Nitrospirillum amazonense]TWB39133.1 DHA1 family tetracycline resistance protein-like MFS transporter [Nitrospirillum amazonense]
MPRNVREALILLVLLLDALGCGVVTPVLPTLVLGLSGNEAAAGRDIGLLNATYAAALFLFSPIQGRLSDRFGRRPFILLGLMGGLAHYVTAALTPSLWLLFAARLLGGLCGANAAAANAYMADIVPPDRRTAMFGCMGAAFGLGLGLGPGLGGLLGGLDPRLPFWMAAALTGTTAILGWVLLPESLQPAARRTLDWTAANPLAPFLSRRQTATAHDLLAGIFLYVAGQTALQTTWVLFLRQSLGWGAAEVGLSLTVLGLVWGVAQLGLTPLVTRHLGDGRALLLGLTMTIVAYTLYGFVQEGWQLYAIMAGTAVAFVTGPTAQGVLSRQAPPGRQGELQGLATSITSLGAIAGPILGGASFSYLTDPEGSMALPGGAFLVSALLSLMTLGFAIRALSRERRQQGGMAGGDGGLMEVRLASALDHNGNGR